MDWNQFASRRRVTLAEFIGECNTEEDALAMFQRMRVSDPPLNEIRQVLTSRNLPQVEPEAAQESPVSVDDPQPSVTAKKTKNASGTPGN